MSSGSAWLRKTKEQWINYAKSLLHFLDLRSKIESNELISQMYELTLTLLTRVSSSLNISQTANRLTSSDKDLISTVDKHSLNQSTINFSIPRYLSQLCCPAFIFNSKIVGFNSSGQYLSVLVEANRVIIYSMAGTPFKLG